VTVTVDGVPPPGGGVEGDVGEPPPPQLASAKAPAHTNAIGRIRRIDLVLQGTGGRLESKAPARTDRGNAVVFQ
jgi:hypothetical protein